MPGRDGTGPQGLGTMTGRGLGPCAGSQSVGRGCGLGLGLGRRNGFRGGFGRASAGWQSLNQRETLLEQKELLQRRIALIDKQLTDE